MEKSVVQKIELPELEETSQGADATAKLPLPFLGNMKVALEVRVGSLSLSVDALRSLKRDQVLTLDNALNDPVEVVVDGHVVARGTLVAAGDNFGVHISELLLASN